MPKVKNPKFNHAFTLSFQVEKSDHEDWADCMKKEKEKVVNSLMERINSLLSNESEYMQAIEGFDTHEE